MKSASVAALILVLALTSSSVNGRALKQAITSTLANQAAQNLTQLISGGAPVPAPGPALAPEASLAGATAPARRRLQQADTDADADESEDGTDPSTYGPVLLVPVPAPSLGEADDISAAIAPIDADESAGSRRRLLAGSGSLDDGSSTGTTVGARRHLLQSDVNDDGEDDEAEAVVSFAPAPAPGPYLAEIAALIAPESAGARRHLLQSDGGDAEDEDSSDEDIFPSVPVPAPAPLIEEVSAILAPLSDDNDDGSTRRLLQTDEDEDDSSSGDEIAFLVPVPAPAPLLAEVAALLAPEDDNDDGSRRRLLQSDGSGGDDEEAEEQDDLAALAPVPAPAPLLSEIASLLAPETDSDDGGDSAATRRHLLQSLTSRAVGAAEKYLGVGPNAPTGAPVPAPAPAPSSTLSKALGAVKAVGSPPGSSSLLTGILGR